LKKSRFTEAQIVAILREAEKGEMPINELCRVHGVAESAFYPQAHQKRQRSGVRRQAGVPQLIGVLVYVLA